MPAADPELIAATERWFLRRGIPHFIDDYRASEDVFTRALPVLGVVFVMGIFGAANLAWGWLANVGAVAAAVVAVVAVWAALVDGPVNVAPDGWLTPTERRALDPVPKVRLPESVALGVADWRWRLRLAPTAPGVLAYARHPWVVANDRLTATGWTASNSNEEAYVAGHQARAIETISPQRRQELALGVVAATVAAAGAGVAALIRNRRHSS